jgi:lipopolysaccharide/colanic/teichoic acid biosynthesis glycosyltransferase
MYNWYQLINVLNGEMSIVGPRPHSAAHDNYFGQIIANYVFRQRMNPGIAGCAQVNGAERRRLSTPCATLSTFGTSTTGASDLIPRYPRFIPR